MQRTSAQSAGQRLVGDNEDMVHNFFTMVYPHYRPSSALRVLTLAFLLLFSPFSHARIDVLGLGEPAVATNAAVVQTEQVRAELVLDAPKGWQVGAPLRLGLLLQHAPGWHTYWKNSGDSGAATTLSWQLPAGSQAGEIAWPLPQKIALPGMVNYGYEDEVLLSVPVQISQAATAEGQVVLQAKWLVCKIECIPQSGSFSLPVPTGSSTDHAAQFAQSLTQVPQDLPAATPPYVLTVDAKNESLTLSGLPASAKPLAVFAEEPQLIAHASAPESTSADGEQQLRMPLNESLHTAPSESFWVLSDGQKSWRARAVTQGGSSAFSQTALYQRNNQGMAISPALAAALEANTQTKEQANSQTATLSRTAAAPSGLLWVLLLAFGGGLLLNLMPCVFPVLAIKALAVVKSKDASHRKTGALAYAVGVILSFVLLAALLIGLKAGGAALGWGFQLQSPAVVLALALLFTLLALNLAGAFELGQVLPQRWLQASSRHPLVDSFLTGVLAVAVASPCTGPFMGVALGYALAQNAFIALLVFAALGLGMALPYVLLAFVPRLGAWLPKPGAWMDAFKRVLALPLWLTVVWLLWVLGQQVGVDATAYALALLVLVATTLTLWTAGLRRSALVVLVFGLVTALVLRAEISNSLPTSNTANTVNAVSSNLPSGAWQDWSAQKQSEATATGRPVFVDYTAAWCVTCQYNKKAVLHQASINAAFASKNVLLLRADWTRYDAHITAALQALGRSGVPVYVLINAQGQQTLLPELLTEQIVLDALQTLPDVP